MMTTDLSRSDAEYSREEMVFRSGTIYSVQEFDLGGVVFERASKRKLVFT